MASSEEWEYYYGIDYFYIFNDVIKLSYSEFGLFSELGYCQLYDVIENFYTRYANDKDIVMWVKNRKVPHLVISAWSDGIMHDYVAYRFARSGSLSEFGEYACNKITVNEKLQEFIEFITPSDF